MSKSIEPIKAKFLGKGTVRLFREFEDDSDTEDIEPTTNTAIEGDDTMLSIVSIPTYFTATDLLGFIGEQFMDYITHIRILRSDRANRFLVLLKFNNLVKTAEFQYKFDGKPFNSMEPENCHVIYVKSIKIDSPNPQDKKLLKSAKDSLIPFLLNDPFTANNSYLETVKEDSTIDLNPSLVELPTCPVCLERMDANITGLLTIPCQHTFHCQCLSKWKDDTCPICRYSNNVSNQKVRRSIRRLSQYNASRQSSIVGIGLGGSSAGSSTGTSSSVAPSSAPSSASSGMGPLSRTSSLDTSAIDNEAEHCTECTITDNLWICLVCGNIGCGRYSPDQHSLKHFIHTGHCFAMEMNTSRVWDYAGDNYVHRLITNESDGKLVELPDKNSNSTETSKLNSNFDKVDQVGFEYSQLLISQLASQKEYYESLLSQNNILPPVSRRNSSMVSVVNNKVTDLEVKVDELQDQLSRLTSDLIPSLKDKIKAKDVKINTLAKELNETKIFNESLSTKIEFLTNSKTELESQNQDLNEQIKDLMFYLESQEKFKDEPQDVKDGTILIQQDPNHNKSKKKNKKKK